MSVANIIRKLFFAVMFLGLCINASNVMALTPDCPECPAEKDGSIFPGGSCKRCKKDPVDKDGSIFPGGSCERCKKKEAEVVYTPPCAECPVPEFKTKNYTYAQPRYKSGAVNRNCCDLASFELKHVDFNLQDQEGYNPYANHVGDYRFRIFGCRRANKKAMLNHGRLIQKDMAFFDVFKKSVDECYKLVEVPSDVCLADEAVRLPEYVLTAEITNFFMNVCDEFDWKKLKRANRRNGSAEMTVTWRLMNPSQTKVFWKGVTTGYADVEEGVFEGEVRLAEAAFADASAMLSTLPGFEAQLMVRPTDEEMMMERVYLVDMDEQFNPGKCQFEEEIVETHSCEYAPQPKCMAQVAEPAAPVATVAPADTVAKEVKKDCPCAVQKACKCQQPICNCVVPSCPCAPAEPKVEEFVDVKTQTQTIEKKVITTTRVETPQPVCQQICRPVCQVVAEEPKKLECPVECEQKCEKPKCRTVCTKTCNENGENCSEETCVEDCGDEPIVEKVVVEPQIEEDGGVDVENVTVEPQIEEDGGVSETHRVYENCIDEAGNVISDGSCTIIDDNWVDLEGYNVDAKLCIVDRPPYSELSPENMLKIQGSVVEITNVKGKKASGLIISDSFVLTSAGVVNKLQNTYVVKTINGEEYNAKAVRVNPSKNTALLHLEKTTNYTPISLNLELPAIDKEGFISVGLGGNSQSYLDDNGKVYGYRYSDNLGTEIVVDTLVNKVSEGSILIDKLGTVNGISNSARQTDEGMDLFIPTETALRSLGVTVCEKIYEKKSPWEKTVYKPVTEKVKQETVAPEVLEELNRK